MQKVFLNETLKFGRKYDLQPLQIANNNSLENANGNNFRWKKKK